ncbi:MAG: rRNA adenine dimethyltransferase family protein [bacterium]|nr:rRNA adenine dimethyltransferase family protein [bacterium]
MDLNQIKEIYTSRTRLPLFLKEHSLYLKKRQGQNFLFDRNVIDKIVQTVPFGSDDILEIGPGVGHITLFYSHRKGKKTLIEIDKGFCRVLEEIFRGNPDLHIIHADVLKYDLMSGLEEEKKYLVFSNLPYNCASQILLKLISFYPQIREVYCMLPDIFMEKLTAPDNCFRNKLGVWLNLYFRVEKLFPVRKNSFFPEPEINSVFIKLIPCETYLKNIRDLSRLKNMIPLLFSQKRKILKSILQDSKNSSQLASFFPKRIDELSLEEIVHIINLL